MVTPLCAQAQDPLDVHLLWHLPQALMSRGGISLGVPIEVRTSRGPSQYKDVVLPVWGFPF